MGKLPSLGSCFTSRKLPQYVAAIIANVMAVSYGVVAGWSSPSLPLLKSEETAIGEPISEEQETWLGSLIHLTALLASPVYSYINQNWGRKAAGYLTVLPLTIGWILIIFSTSVFDLYIARILMGTSMTGVNVFVVMYIGEISEDSIRGALGVLRGIGVDFGILLAYAIAPYLSIHGMGMVSITMPLFFLTAFFWLPESPMFLLGKGKHEEALKAYIWLRGGDKKIAEEEMKKLSLVVHTSSKKVTLREILAVRGTRNALLITIVFAVVIQFSGMYVVSSYASKLLEQSGSNIPPDFAAIIIGVVSTTGSLMAIFTDIAGRRIILISTQFFEGLNLGGLGIYLYFKNINVDVEFLGMLPVIFISLYCFFIAAGVATLGYVVISETFRPEARGIAMNVMSTLTWGFAFVTTKFHQSLEYEIGLHGCFWFYAGVSFAGALFTYIKVPETKNRSLDSILRELNGDPRIDEVQ